MDVGDFEAERPRLTAIAYRMLGDVGAAEDVVQDAWLRVREGDPVSEVRAYLSRVVVRLCLDARRAAGPRETYTGPWIAEPFRTDAPPTDSIELAEDLTLAAMRLLESLGPLERAVFVLHDVAGCPYSEIATTLGRSEDAVRQLASRARKHLSEGRRKVAIEPATAAEFVGRVMTVAASGDVDALAGLLAPDAVLHTDHGGRATANRIDINGAAHVAKALVALTRQGLAHGGSARFEWINGQPALVGLEHGAVTSASLFELDVVDGRMCVRRFDVHRNPEKLSRLGDA